MTVRGTVSSCHRSVGVPAKRGFVGWLVRRRANPLRRARSRRVYPSVFVLYNKGFEGQVVNDSPGDCQSLPPLRRGPRKTWFCGVACPQTGESLAACQKQTGLPVCFCFVEKLKSSPVWNTLQNKFCGDSIGELSAKQTEGFKPQ